MRLLPALLLAAAATACGGDPPPSLLLVTIDTLRADAVSRSWPPAARASSTPRP